MRAVHLAPTQTTAHLVEFVCQRLNYSDEEIVSRAQFNILLHTVSSQGEASVRALKAEELPQAALENSANGKLVFALITQDYNGSSALPVQGILCHSISEPCYNPKGLGASNPENGATRKRGPMQGAFHLPSLSELKNTVGKKGTVLFSRQGKPPPKPLFRNKFLRAFQAQCTDPRCPGQNAGQPPYVR